MSHDSFAVSEDVIAEFEAAHNAKVELLPSAMLAQRSIRRSRARRILADVFSA
jgi:hypothetical protein